MLKIALNSLRETAAFGRKLGEIALPGDVILLNGDLGSGKTTLTQSIALGLEIPGENYVTSPSFSLMNRYDGRIPLYHIDCYRLHGEDDVEGSGLMDYIVADGLTVVEWPDRLGSLKPDERLDVFIRVADEARILSMEAHGTRWRDRLPALTRYNSEPSAGPGPEID